MTVRQVVTLPRLRSALPPAACWVWTRAVLVMFTYKIIPYISQGDIVGDVKLYNQWSQIFAHGHFPHDPQWQYPPGAAFVIVLPRLLRSVTGISYYSAFYLMALLSDLIIFLLVLYASWQTAARRAAAAGLAPDAAGAVGTIVRGRWTWRRGWATARGRGMGGARLRNAWRGKIGANGGAVSTAASSATAAAAVARHGAAASTGAGPGAANGTAAHSAGPGAPNGAAAPGAGPAARPGMPPVSAPGSDTQGGLSPTSPTGSAGHSGMPPTPTPASVACTRLSPNFPASADVRDGLSPASITASAGHSGVPPTPAPSSGARNGLASAAVSGSGGACGISASAVASGSGSGGRSAQVSASSPGSAGVSVRPDYTGVWAYTVAIFMIGPIVLGRYDLMVTMVATVALVAAGRSGAATWRIRGAAIGLGTVLKLWPAAIAVGLPKRADGRRALVWAVVAALVPAVVLAAFLPGSMGFLTGQHDRGLEIESVPATLFLIARHFGYPARIRHQYGAFEITGPGISVVSWLAVLLTVAGFVWLLAVWRRRADLAPGRWSTALYYDAGLVAVLIAIVTSRVLSPQYLVWLVGLIALCLTLAPHASDGVVLESGAVSSGGAVLEPGTVVGSRALRRPGASPSAPADAEGRSVLAGPSWLLLAAISVTQVDFPLLFPRLIHDGRWAAWFLGSRNLLLLAAAVWSMAALWRTVAPAPRPATRGEQAVVSAEPRSRVAQPEQQPAGQ